MRFTSIIRYVGIIFLAVVLTGGIQSVDAGMSRLRMTTKPVSRAIRTNVKQALKPTLTIRSRHAGPMTAVDIDKHANLLATADQNGNAQIWDLRTGRRDHGIRSGADGISSLIFLKGRGRMATGGVDGSLSVWRVKDGRRTERIRMENGPIGDMGIAADGTLIYTVGTGGNAIWAWDLRDRPVAHNGFHPGSISSLTVGPAGLLVATGGTDGRIQVSRWPSAEPLMRAETQAGETLDLAFTEDGRFLVAGFESGRLEAWDVARGRKIFSADAHPGAVQGVGLNPAGTILASGGADGTLAVWSIAEGNELLRFDGHTAGVNAVGFTPNGKFLVSASSDRTTRFWDIEAASEMARLISMRSGWAVVSPDGFFDGTLDGDVEERLDAVQWEVGEQALSIDGFLERYYSPAFLGRLLAGREVKRYGKAPSIADGFALPPKVRILTPKGGKTVRQDTVEVSVEAVDEGGDIDEIRLFHNKKVVDDRRADVETTEKGNQKRVVKTYTVPLVDGKNELQSVGFNYIRIESAPDEILVSYKAPDPPPPALHIMTVGINEYENPELNLNFGVPDARAVLNHFVKHHASLFQRMFKYELFNSQATQASIYNLLEVLSKIPPQDTVVIYFAGHGESLRDNWYFVPHDLTEPYVDAKLEENGISSSMLQLYIARIGAQKIFLMMDSCKSGAAVDVFSAYDDNRPFALLSRAVGIHIAAAAAKEQYAGELESLGHGVFTYILLEALNGKADLKPIDGTISVQETLGYIREEMPQIVDQYNIPTQEPVINSRGMDFEVAAISNP